MCDVAWLLMFTQWAFNTRTKLGDQDALMSISDVGAKLPHSLSLLGILSSVCVCVFFLLLFHSKQRSPFQMKEAAPSERFRSVRETFGKGRLGLLRLLQPIKNKLTGVNETLDTVHKAGLSSAVQLGARFVHAFFLFEGYKREIIQEGGHPRFQASDLRLAKT